MTALLERSPAGTNRRDDSATDRRLPSGARRRRPLLVAVSAVVVLVSVAAFVSLYSTARRQEQVLVATRTIQRGQLLIRSILGTASVNISGGADPISAGLASSLAGKRAAVTIPAGSLLVPGDLTGAPSVQEGDAVVGVALKDGQYPSTGLRPTDQVMVVQTASPGSPLPLGGASAGASSAPAGSSTGSSSSTAAVAAAPGVSTGVLVPQAAVFDVSSPASNTGGSASLLVSVEVPSTLAASVSTAAAAGQVSLVLLPDGGAAG